jgi:uncharacterized phiE125 gp8 family phage protein
MHMMEILEMPSGLPVSVTEMKSFLRLDLSATSEDALLMACLKAGVEALESALDVSLVTRVLRYTFGGGESVLRHSLTLPRAPVQTITLLEVLSDSVAGYTAVSGSLWIQVGNTLRVKNVRLLPAVEEGSIGYRVTYTAGFGSAESGIFPALMKHVIMTLTASLYQGKSLERALLGEGMSVLRTLYGAKRLV